MLYQRLAKLTASLAVVSMAAIASPSQAIVVHVDDPTITVVQPLSGWVTVEVRLQPAVRAGARAAAQTPAPTALPMP